LRIGRAMEVNFKMTANKAPAKKMGRSMRRQQVTIQAFTHEVIVTPEKDSEFDFIREPHQAERRGNQIDH
jgi:hypothetical protein